MSTSFNPFTCNCMRHVLHITRTFKYHTDSSNYNITSKYNLQRLFKKSVNVPNHRPIFPYRKNCGEYVSNIASVTGNAKATVTLLRTYKKRIINRPLFLQVDIRKYDDRNTNVEHSSTDASARGVISTIPAITDISSCDLARTSIAYRRT